MTSSTIDRYYPEVRKNLVVLLRAEASTIGEMIASALRERPEGVPPRTAKIIARKAARKAIDADAVAAGRVLL